MDRSRAAHPALLPRSRRDPGHSAGATLRGTAGTRVEPASLNASRTMTLKSMWIRKQVIGAVLILLTLPAAFAVIEAVTFYVANRNNGSIVSSGETREYLLYVPRSYDRTRPTPLVISMHGAGGWPAQQMDMSGWNRQAEREGFLVVYPSGVERGGPRIWHVERGDGLMKDVRFISELIERLEASYNIDPARIYANGLSNGGGMTFVLSCTLSDRIAAVGMVAAAQTLPWRWCTDLRPA